MLDFPVANVVSLDNMLNHEDYENDIESVPRNKVVKPSASSMLPFSALSQSSKALFSKGCDAKALIRERQLDNEER